VNLNRRTLLKAGLASGALLAGAGPLIVSCGGTRRAGLAADPASGAAVAGLDPRRRTILHYAALAPSGHNSQPWQVRIDAANRWVIGFDPDRRLPAVDPDNRELLLSVGAFAENLRLAAGTLGLQADIRVVAQSPHDSEITAVRLRESPVRDYPRQRLARRMTVRSGFRPDEIRPADLAVLTGHLKGRLLYFPRGTVHARCIAEGVAECFRNQANRIAAQRELTRWLRLSDADARTHRDGLTTASMGIKGFKGWWLRHFARPADFMRPAFRRQGIQHTAELARQGGGWLIVTSPGNRVADLIDTGQRFQRLALRARERGLALHPMMQILEEPDGRRLIATLHDAGLMPQFVLRAGYLSRYPHPVSLRRPVDAFVEVGQFPAV
jgi:hypothetical protein